MLHSLRLALTMALALGAGLHAPLALAIDVPTGFEDTEVFSSLAEPSALEFAPDGRMFIAERIQGRLRVATQDPTSGSWTLEPTPFYTFDIPADASGNPIRYASSGLMDFAFDPNFATNGYVYVYYMKNQPRQNRLVRITASTTNPNVAVANSELLLMELPANSTNASGSHVGGAVEFGADGKLYVSTGDGFTGGNPVQSLSTFTGKVLRLSADGSIPTDNPFYSQASGNYRAIYALGFRNPFSMSRHPVSGTLYVNDVRGPSKADLFQLTPGLNAGYPTPSSIGNATNEWADAGGQNGYVVAGGDWCPASAAFPPTYHGRYFLAFWGSNTAPSGKIQTLQSETNTSLAPFADNVFETTTSCGGSLTIKPAFVTFGPDGRLYYILTNYETPCGALRCVRWLSAVQLNAPTIAPPAGWYAGSIQVTLTLSGPSGQIRYTLDGSDPTPASTLYSGPFMVSQDTLLKTRAFEAGSGLAGPIASAQYTIGALRAPDSVANPASGLSYRYFEGTWSALPDLAALSPIATGTASGFDLGVRQRNDEFGLSFTGYVMVPTAGAYTFQLISDDGSRLWIGSTLVVENDHVGGFATASGSIGLAAGLHSVTVAYFDQFGSEGLGVAYGGPGFALTPIPASALFRAANQPPTADAGPDQMVLINRLVELDGSLSSDPETNTQSLAWSWQQLSGPTVTLQQTSDLVARFTPTVAGTYAFELEVGDGEFTDTDTVVVQVIAPPAGLIRHWRLDEGTGSAAIDAVSGQTGTLVGPSWSGDGRLGGALDFDGTNDRVDLGPIAPVGGTGLSLACWFRADDFGQADGRLISRATGTAEADHYFMLSTMNGTGLRFRLRAGGSTTTLTSPDGVIAAGAWHHVVATYDGAQMRLYRDAVLVATTAKTGVVDMDAGVLVALGNQPQGAGSRPFDGLIDEVRIYDRALALPEVAALAGCLGTGADCNGNDIDDDCELADGTAADCDQNGTLDGCDLAADPSLDCNTNGMLDTCELAAGTGADCNQNGILDACDLAADSSLDCNTNGMLDTCELAAGTGADCNQNGILDACDLAADSSLDCNTNGMLDTCELAAGTGADCNQNGILDACDLAADSSLDCNTNGMLDTCELAAGTAADCNQNGILDACDLDVGNGDDCDANGVLDACDLAGDPTRDQDGNGVLDVCQATPFLRGDVQADGTVNLADYVTLLSFLFSVAGGPIPCANAADTDGSGVLNLVDVIYMGYYLFAGGSPPAAPFPDCGVAPASLPDLGCGSYLTCP
ncbi:MAG: PQQ-dependent sugar dehydrogenase [Planctomycetota bacterium]